MMCSVPVDATADGMRVDLDSDKPVQRNCGGPWCRMDAKCVRNRRPVSKEPVTFATGKSIRQVEIQVVIDKVTPSVTWLNAVCLATALDPNNHTQTSSNHMVFHKEI